MHHSNSCIVYKPYNTLIFTLLVFILLFHIFELQVYKKPHNTLFLFFLKQLVILKKRGKYLPFPMFFIPLHGYIFPSDIIFLLSEGHPLTFILVQVCFLSFSICLKKPLYQFHAGQSSSLLIFYKNCPTILNYTENPM